MKDENIHIGVLLHKFLSYWRIYIPVGLVCLIGAIIFILITPKEYEFNSRMQLIREQQGMISELKMLKNTGLAALMGGVTSDTSVEDEIIILLSRTNVTAALLQTGYQIEHRTWDKLQHKLLYGTDAPVNYLFPEGFLDTISKPIKIELELENKRIKHLKVKSKLFKTIKIQEQSLPYVLQLPVGNIHLTSNPDYTGTPSIDFTSTITPMQKLYEEMVKDELYAASEETISDIIRLVNENENKQRGCDLLNALMQCYNRYSKNVKVKEANLNAQFIKERLDSTTFELSLIEHRLEKYKQENKLPDPMLYTQAAITGQKELETNMLEMEVQLKMMDYVVDYINNPNNQYASVPLIEGIGDKSVMLYNQLLLDRQRLLLSSQQSNPALVLTEQQLTDQRRMLAESIDAARRSLRASLQKVQQKNHTVTNQLMQLPTQEREYIELKRQQKIKETIYLFLLQKLQEKELANAPDEQACRIIDAAYCSAKPVFPKKSIVLVVAFILACMVSVCIISVRLFSNRKS